MWISRAVSVSMSRCSCAAPTATGPRSTRRGEPVDTAGGGDRRDRGALAGRRWCRPATRSRCSARCRTGMWPRWRRWPHVWACPSCWARRAGRATWRGVDHLAGACARLEAVHADTVGRYHARRRPRCRRRVHRRGVRGDGLAGRAAKTRSKRQLAARHLGPAVNPSRMAMFDLSSSWVTGRHCELAARGYSRDGKKGLRADRIRSAHRPPDARSRSGCSPATPPTRPRSPSIVDGHPDTASGLTNW